MTPARVHGHCESNAGVNAPGYSGRLFETVARISDDRCENLRATCHRSRVRYDRFPDVARSSRLACARSRAFSRMNDMTVAGIDDSGVITCPPGSPIPATGMSILFIGAWRAIAVAVFSLCALVQNMITISFVRRATTPSCARGMASSLVAICLPHPRHSRNNARLEALIRSFGQQPSQLPRHRCTQLDSAMRLCGQTRCRDVAALWLAGACCRNNFCRSRAKILHPQSGGCRWRSNGYRLSGCSVSGRNKLGWFDGVAI